MDSIFSAEIVRRLRHEPNELLVVGFLAADASLLGWERYPGDCPRSVNLPLRAIARRALVLDARSIALAHNHPSGNKHPSSHDIAATRHLVRTCRDIGIEVDDHLIVAGLEVFSFRQAGML